ncbi:MAG: DUF5916 domain-containing protein [Gemmatimonadota bacterium]
MELPTATRMALAGSLAVLALLAEPQASIAQTGAAPVLRAGHSTGGLQIDGRLDEPAWAEADSIAGLTETEPDEGGRPAGRTVVRVLAGPDALIVGVVAYDPDPDGIVSYAVTRDARLDGEDHVRFVLDTYRDGRSGYIFAVNPKGARYDALVANRGEGENSDWDGLWEARTARGPWGWSVEVRIPVRSLVFGEGLEAWGFNIERRIERLQETSRWASPVRDYSVGQTSRAGLLTDLPDFRLGLGLGVRPSLVGGVERSDPLEQTDANGDVSLDVTQRIGTGFLASLTFNTDFAETEVDTRRTNLTRFPLLFPEKRTFFLEGADIFDFGLGLSRDLLPFHSRRIGLAGGQAVPIVVGGKLNGRSGGTSVGALAVRAGEVGGLVPASTMGVVRVRQDVLRESSAGIIATAGDPTGADGAWLAGADFTYQTTRFRGDKNFLVGVWGLATGRDGLAGDRSAVGLKVDYPNDTWDIAFTWRRVGESFLPSLGFVPRTGINALSAGANYRHRTDGGVFRYLYYELRPSAVLDLDGRWESYRLFLAPVNWRFESGDRLEANWVPQGERLPVPFEVVDGVVIPVGEYHWSRYRVEGQFASKRKLSGQATWWFGGYYGGTLHEIQLRGSWNPSPLLTVDLTGERNIGDLPEGSFTVDLVGVRASLGFSPDLQLASYVQYDTETESLGTNTRLRWTFDPLGDLFVVYNHNLRHPLDRWTFDSNQLIVKAQYTFRS